MKTKKLFNCIRFIAIAALVCTVIVTVVMMVESAMPGDESAEQSNSLASSIQSAFGDEKEQTELSRVRVKAVAGFVGETYSLPIEFYPETAADKRLTFSSSNPNVISVDEDGFAHMEGAGEATITASLISNPDITHSATMICYGTHPSKITSVTLSKDSYKVGDNVRFYLKDQDGNKLSLAMFKPSDYDKQLVKFTSFNILPLAEGSVQVTFTIKKNLGNKDYPPRSFSPVTINLNGNKNFIAPTSIIAVSEALDLTINDEIPLDSLVREVLPAGAKKASLHYQVNSDGAIEQINGAKLRASSEGEGEVLISSVFDPSVSVKVTVRVIVPKPDKLRIIAPDRAQTDKKYKLRAFGGGNYINNVTWSVVKGKANISEKGVLSGMKLGKITVRATYVGDDSLFAEYEIKCVLYENFAFSMRKLIGHFMLFAVIGFGLASTFLLFIKPRAIALPLSVATGFGLAVVSEALQLPAVTTGRYATWSDVLIDFFGSTLGVVAALIIFAIILLAFRLSKSRAEFKRALGAVSAKTVFRSTSNAKLSALLTESAASPSDSDRSDGKTPDDISPSSTSDDEASASDADPSLPLAPDNDPSFANSSDSATQTQQHDPDSFESAELPLSTSDASSEAAADIPPKDNK